MINPEYMKILILFYEIETEIIEITLFSYERMPTYFIILLYDIFKTTW